MSTRKRGQDQAPTQQGYSSSPEYERSLLANLVATRAERLDSAADRELFFALQYVSHQSGGLKKFAETLIASHPEQVATTAMQRIGFKAGQIYNAKQVREVRGEVPGGRDRFLLKGEFVEFKLIHFEPETVEVEDLGTGRTYREFNSRVLKAKTAALEHPSSYPSAEFVRASRDAARDHLAERLERLSLDPAAAIEGRWYFPNLIPTLRAHFLCDFFHGSEYLAAAASVCRPAQPDQWRRTQQQRLKSGAVPKVMAALAEHLEAEAAPDQKAPVRRCPIAT